jgi:beta-lactamase class D
VRILILWLAFATEAHAWRDSPAVAALFEARGLAGCFVVYDVSRGTDLGHGEARARTRFVPASTFKIANSLIGLTTGAVASVDEVLPYRATGPAFSPDWERDMGLREAIVVSNVPIYQALARRIGLERMRSQLRLLDYGNAETGELVDRFWLDGPLAISAVEQTRFLARLAQGALPAPSAAQAAVVEITRQASGPGWVLHAKTGWQGAPGPGLGWWVGWVVRGDDIHAFALNVDLGGPADADARQGLGRAALAALGLIEDIRPLD